MDHVYGGSRGEIERGTLTARRNHGGLDKSQNILPLNETRVGCYIPSPLLSSKMLGRKAGHSSDGKGTPTERSWIGIQYSTTADTIPLSIVECA